MYPTTPDTDSFATGAEPAVVDARGIILPDVLRPHLSVVFCGTAPGTASAVQGAYYAGPGNAFWPTLFAIGLIARPLRARQFREILEWNMGLTDLAKHVAGSDSAIGRAHFDVPRLRRVMAEHRPRVLAFTSKRAAEAFLGRSVAYGLLPDAVTATRLFVLPSPSGAARRYWNLEPWRQLQELRATLDR